MKNIKIIAAAVAVLLMGSCQVSEIDREESQTTVIVAPDFHAGFEGQDTKAGFTKEGNVYRHYWELGDCIYVYPKGVSNPYPRKYTCTDVNGTFSFVEEYRAGSRASGTPDKNYAACTPEPQYLRFNAATHEMTFNISGFPDPVGPDRNGAYGYASNMIAASDDTDLTFRNCMGWLKLQLKGTQKVSSISVQQATGSVCMCEGDGITVTYDGSASPSVDISGLEWNYNMISIDAPYAQLSEDHATAFYIPMAPLSLLSMEVSIRFADGTSSQLRKAGMGVDPIVITRNAVTPMAEKYAEAPIIDLSASETANCYIVNDAATTYRFRSDVKGNSNESIGTPVKADVLWTTQMSDVITPSKNSVIKNVRYIDGYVYFETPDTYVKGNTVIAARDAANNILWSWHIWSPGISDITTNVDDFSAKSEGLQFMNYNLGDVEGNWVPLYYEWGRKDPFIRQGVGLYGVSLTWPTSFSIVSGATTVENAIAHPATYYSNTTWQTPENDQLWKDDEKTIYDPCPAGWRVQSYAGLKKVLTYARSDAGPWFYYTDSSARIPGGSYAYMYGLGTLTGRYDGGIFKFYMVAGDSYWTSLCDGDNVYSLDRVGTTAKFRASNIAFSGSGHPVRCMSDK